MLGAATSASRRWLFRPASCRGLRRRSGSLTGPLRAVPPVDLAPDEADLADKLEVEIDGEDLWDT